MKFLLSEFIMICIALLIITQVIIPLFVPNMGLWWFFKKTPKPEPKVTVTPTELKDKVEKTAEEVTELRDSVNSYHKEAEELKQKADKI